jgi:hypothetical protein
VIFLSSSLSLSTLKDLLKLHGNHVLHLMKVLKYIITTNDFSIHGLRGFAGLGNEVELIAICLIILNIKKKIIDLKRIQCRSYQGYLKNHYQQQSHLQQ